jgi:hypothetical protein
MTDREMLAVILANQAVILSRLHAVSVHLAIVNRRITQMSDSVGAELTNLTAAVAAETAADQAALTLINGFAAQLAAAVAAATAAGATAEQLQTFATLNTELQANATALAAAVAANTATVQTQVAAPVVTTPAAAAPAPTPAPAPAATAG